MNRRDIWRRMGTSAAFAVALLSLVACVTDRTIDAQPFGTSASDLDLSDSRDLQFLESRKAYEAGDYVTSRRLVEPLARNGHARSQNGLGLHYLRGLGGLPKDAVTAVEWLRKSAEGGEKRGMYNLARRYSLGEGVAENHAEATRWYEKAYRAGYPMAGYYLGLAYLAGEGVERSPTKGFDILRAVFGPLKNEAAQGGVTAQYVVGRLLLMGVDGTANRARAVEWLRRATEGGSSNAAYRLAMLHVTGEFVTRDRAEAHRLAMQAGDKGHRPAMLFAGVNLLNGIGVEKDEKAGVALIEKAAEAGNQNARIILSSIYFTGKRVPADYARAYRWALAAAKDDLTGQTAALVGYLHETGKGAEKSATKAYAWYEMAAVRGHGFAQYRVAVAHFNGTGARPDPAEAVKWAERALKTLKSPDLRLGAMWVRMLARAKLDTGQRKELAALGYLSESEIDGGASSAANEAQRRNDPLLGGVNPWETLLDETINAGGAANPKLAGASLMLRAIARLARNDMEGALKDLDEAVRLQPGQIDSLLLRGTVRAKAGRLTESETDFTALIALAPTDALHYARRAWVRAQRSNDLQSLVGALEDMKDAYRLSPDHPKLKDLYERLGFFRES